MKVTLANKKSETSTASTAWISRIGIDVMCWKSKGWIRGGICSLAKAQILSIP